MFSFTFVFFAMIFHIILLADFELEDVSRLHLISGQSPFGDIIDKNNLSFETKSSMVSLINVEETLLYNVRGSEVHNYPL